MNASVHGVRRLDRGDRRDPHDRRRLLKLLAAASCAALAGGAGSVLPASLEASGCPPWLEADDLEGVRELGREYLERYPSDRDFGDVWRVLRSAGSAQEPDLSALTRLVRHDYEDGHIVHLAGWFVSRTEARIFAAVTTGC